MSSPDNLVVPAEELVESSGTETHGIEILKQFNLPPDTKAGPYVVRFAQTKQEVQAAQSLRYQVFYNEKEGNPDQEITHARRDFDQWDEGGFHIIVIDTRATDTLKVVGTLRLFLSDCLQGQQQFYTEETFNLDKLRNHFGQLLELSRFCIDSSGRGGVILMLIWKYAMSFIQDNQIPAMVGCASFSGTDTQQHLPILNYLYEHYLAPEALRPEPKPTEYIDLASVFEPEASWDDAKKSIPTLLRGYLKLGAKISDAAIVDPVFNTIYVSIYVETNKMLKENPNLVTHV